MIVDIVKCGSVGKNGQNYVKSFVCFKCDECGEAFKKEYRARHLKKEHHFCCDDCKHKSDIVKQKQSNGSKRMWTSWSNKKRKEVIKKRADIIWRDKPKEEIELMLKRSSRSNKKTYENTKLEHPEILKERAEKRKQTNVEKYGVENTYHIADHDGMMRAEKTKLKKYGDPKYNNPEKIIESLRQRNKKMLLEDPDYNKKWRERLDKILLERYGDPYYNNRPQAIKTWNEKTDEEMLEIAEKMMETCKKNGYGKNNIIAESKKLGKKINCRSSYEKDVIEDIFENDDSVISFEYEPCVISYKFDGKTRKYFPDFLVDLDSGNKMLVEVKPECFVSDSINIAKFEAAINYCKDNNLKFKILTEKEIYNNN
jgi:hypothetical protein